MLVFGSFFSFYRTQGASSDSGFVAVSVFLLRRTQMAKLGFSAPTQCGVPFAHMYNMSVNSVLREMSTFHMNECPSDRALCDCHQQSFSQWVPFYTLPLEYLSLNCLNYELTVSFQNPNHKVVQVREVQKETQNETIIFLWYVVEYIASQASILSWQSIF